MECLILFSGEKGKHFKMWSVEIFTQHVEHYFLYAPLYLKYISRLCSVLENYLML